MGPASPYQPQRDMEGYYSLLQAGTELENTLQREYSSHTDSSCVLGVSLKGHHPAMHLLV